MGDQARSHSSSVIREIIKNSNKIKKLQKNIF
jgi:hypothetical protein